MPDPKAIPTNPAVSPAVATPVAVSKVDAAREADLFEIAEEKEERFIPADFRTTGKPEILDEAAIKALGLEEFVTAKANDCIVKLFELSDPVIPGGEKAGNRYKQQFALIAYQDGKPVLRQRLDRGKRPIRKA